MVNSYKKRHRKRQHAQVLLFWIFTVFFLQPGQAWAKCYFGEGCWVNGIKLKSETTSLSFDLGSFVKDSSFGDPTQNAPIALGFKPTFFWGWLEGQMHFDMMSIDPYTAEGPISVKDLNEVAPDLFPEYEDISGAVYQLGLEKYQTIEIGYALAFEGWKLFPFWPLMSLDNNSYRILNVGVGFGVGYMEAEGLLVFCESSACRRRSINSFSAQKTYTVLVSTANLLEINTQSLQIRLFTITRGQVDHEFVIVNNDSVPFTVKLDTIELVSLSWFI
jgi:hypothetical protein